MQVWELGKFIKVFTALKSENWLIHLTYDGWIEGEIVICQRLDWTIIDTTPILDLKESLVEFASELPGEKRGHPKAKFRQHSTDQRCVAELIQGL